MPGLVNAPAGMLKSGRQLGGLCLAGQAVWEKAGTFPAELLRMSGDYVHFAAEDAGGAIWMSRNGLPLSLDRVGTPTVSGGWLDCATGCYDALRNPWPAETAFTLWGIFDGSRRDIVALASDTAVGSNQQKSLRLFLNGKMGSGYTTHMASLPPASGAESLEWARPAGSAYLSQTALWHNAISMTHAGSDRGISSAGEALTIGGVRAYGETIPTPSGARIRDAILTIGWTLTAEHRAALEAYRLARLA